MAPQKVFHMNTLDVGLLNRYYRSGFLGGSRAPKDHRKKLHRTMELTLGIVIGEALLSITLDESFVFIWYWLFRGVGLIKNV